MTLCYNCIVKGIYGTIFIEKVGKQMLKKVISAVLSVAVVSAVSISAMAAVEVGGSSTTISPGEKLSTGAGQYKTVLVTSEGADLSTLTAEQIYYIDQAENDVQAFTNMGLKGGANIAPGNYIMYLVGENDIEPTSQEIIVSDVPFESGGESFDAISGDDGKNPPYKNSKNELVMDQGYKVQFTPESGRTVRGYKIYISYTQGSKTYTYPKEVELQGEGTLNVGLQINGIPCDESGTPSVEFTAKLVPLYFN